MNLGTHVNPIKLMLVEIKSQQAQVCFISLPQVCLDSEKLFLLESRITETKLKFGYKKEIKSTDISLPLYEALLKLINELDIMTFYRLVDKAKYKGTFAVSGVKRLHNIFDEYNLAKAVSFALNISGFKNTEVIIDRADRRLLDGKFDNFNSYLLKKVNTKTLKKIAHITHVNSEYVNAMQMSDLISGAIKYYFIGKNKELKKIINTNLLKKIH